MNVAGNICNPVNLSLSMSIFSFKFNAKVNFFGQLSDSFLIFVG